MSKGAKRRREARRRARERDQAPTGEPRQETRSAFPDGEPEPESSERVAPAQTHSVRKKAKRRPGVWQRLRHARISPWLIVTPVAAVGVVILVVLILTSGSSGTSAGRPSAEPTPDPRVAGLIPDVTVNIEAGGAADDAYFSPNRIQAQAGDVVEIVVTNVGTVSHNLRVAGLDDEFFTPDDFEMPPNVILPGETETLVVKMDEPGSYLFRCDFHPLVQTGTLVLE